MHNKRYSRGPLAGVDIGGTKIAVLLADEHGRELGRHVAPTRLDSVECTLESIAQAVRYCAEAAGVDAGQIAAVGLGVPGIVDTRTGVVQRAVNLRWDEVEAGARLTKMLGTPFVLENDVRLAAVGLQRRALKGGTPGHGGSMAYLSIGTGISAGLILDGKLYRGAHGMAGEIGHIIIDAAGTRCACGLSGCLETVAAGPGIAQQARQALAAGEITLLSRHERITAEGMYVAASEGDEVALSIASKVGGHLARAVHLLVMLYDVEQVVIGGGVSRSGSAFLSPILAALESMCEQSPLAGAMLRPGMITLADPEYDAGTWGAVAMASDYLEQNHEY